MMSSSALSNVNFGTVVAATSSPLGTNPNSPVRVTSSLGGGGTPTRAVVPGRPVQHFQDEDVLKDVLDELDRERTKRAELEETVRALQQQVSQQQNQNNTPNNTSIDNKQQGQLNQTKRGTQQTSKASSEHVVTPEVIARIEAQVRGYQDLLNAVTANKPAIVAAADAETEEFQKNMRGNTSPKPTSRRPPALPLNAVRYLEIMPWDTKCYNWIYVTDYVYEWQVYASGKWQSQIRYFPPHFKQLPFVQPHSIQEKEILSKTSSITQIHIRSNGAAPSYLNTNIATVGSGGNRILNNTNHNSNNNNNNRSFLHFLAGGENVQHTSNTGAGNLGTTDDFNNKFLGGKHATYTNSSITLLYSMEHGYPMPQHDGGVWEAVGHFHVNTKTKTSDNGNVGYDSEGWSYTSNCFNFYDVDDDDNESDHGIFDSPYEGDHDEIDDDEESDDEGTTSDKQNEKNSGTLQRTPLGIKYPIRRRQWSRLRVLVDYHLSCESTRHYLNVVCDNSKLSYAVGKITDQLLVTRTLLSELTHKLEQRNTQAKEHESQISRMAKEIEGYKKHIEIGGLTHGDNHMIETMKDDAFLKLKEFVGTKNTESIKEIGMELSNRGKETVRELSNLGKGSVKELVTSKLSAESMKDFGSIIASTVSNHGNKNSNDKAHTTSNSTNSQNAEQLKDLGFKISQWVTRKLSDGDHHQNVSTADTKSITTTLTAKTATLAPSNENDESTIDSGLVLTKPSSTDSSSSAASTANSITIATLNANDTNNHQLFTDIENIHDEEIVFSNDDYHQEVSTDHLPSIGSTSTNQQQSNGVVPQHQHQSSLIPERFDWMSIGSSSFMNRIKGATIQSAAPNNISSLASTTSTTTVIGMATSGTDSNRTRKSSFDASLSTAVATKAIVPNE